MCACMQVRQRVSSKLGVVLSRWRSGFLGVVAYQWRVWAARKRRNRRKVARGAQRLLAARKNRVLTAFLHSAREAREVQGKQEQARVQLELTKRARWRGVQALSARGVVRGMQEAWGTWWGPVRRARLLRKVAGRWQKRSLARGWLCWEQWHVAFVKARDVAARVLGRWRQQALARCVEAWRRLLVRQKHLQAAGTRVVLRWKNGALSAACAQWTHAVCLRRLLEKIAIRWRRRAQWSAFAAWATHAERQRLVAEKCLRLIGRWMHRSVCCSPCLVKPATLTHLLKSCAYQIGSPVRVFCCMIRAKRLPGAARLSSVDCDTDMATCPRSTRPLSTGWGWWQLRRRRSKRSRTSAPTLSGLTGV